jgi:hypothetical protein
VSPPDWNVSLPRRKRRWPLRKKSLLTPTLAHTIRVASVWPPFDYATRDQPRDRRRHIVGHLIWCSRMSIDLWAPKRGLNRKIMS